MTKTKAPGQFTAARGVMTVLAIATLAACGTADTPGDATSGSAASQPATPTSLDPSSVVPPSEGKSATRSAKPMTVAQLGATRLSVVMKATPDAKGVTRTLTCNSAGGTVTEPAAACAQLAKAGGYDALQPLPKDGMSCTQQIAGQAVASVTGTVQGRTVDVTLAQTDGCKISQWNNLSSLLGSKAGTN